MLDWELKASSTPYDNIQELSFEYSLGPLRNFYNVEFIAFNVASIDVTSIITGNKGRLAVRLALGLEPAGLTLGYRLFINGRVVRRCLVNGSEMR